MRANVPPVLPAAQVPRATYRLQFHEHFRLRDALALVPYLHELGISHLYASPLFKARPHSTHGYDVCDFNELNPELGSENDLRQLVMALQGRGMGLVLDVVPNHMGIGGPENSWWWDVLTHGRASEFAHFFDIDWQSPDPQLRGKVFVPVLKGSYDEALGRGEIQLARRKGTFVLRYLDHLFPINGATLPAGVNILEINASAKAMDDLVQQQHYLLSDWRAADSKLNYRRFFTITSLAGVRMEDEQVFNATHRLIKQWLDADWVTGLRVDHPDGLRAPEQYLRRLRNLAPKSWIVVEKILEPGESLPATCPLRGTTGYDFLNRAEDLFIDPNGRGPLTDFYAEFTQEPTDYSKLAHQKKRTVLEHDFDAEVTRLTRLLLQIDRARKPSKPFTAENLRQGIIELAACFPVYRTYLRPRAIVSQSDAACIKQAIKTARQMSPELPAKLFGFLGDLLYLRKHGKLEIDFAMRFQQLTGAAMAKGIEDTAFYCYNRLLGRNEVGGDPARFGTEVKSFHEACRAAQHHWPDAMLATSTHDTKRSEDVRARLALLSEVPHAWPQAVRRWSAMNERHRRGHWPDRNIEYFFYQTLLGAWPVTLERALQCLKKAAREAKQHTSWAQPNETYENALDEFVTGALADKEFTRDLEQFLTPLADAACINSLALTLLKLTTPGVPDFYQGSELWDLSLMDPDNRRPVNFAVRRRLLKEIKQLSLAEIWRRRAEGLPKLWLIQRVLELRAERPNLFSKSAGFKPFPIRGAKARHAVAFMRDADIIVIVPRLVLGLAGDWAHTSANLPGGKWRNLFTGEDISTKRIAFVQLLRHFPVALLTRTEAGS